MTMGKGFIVVVFRLLVAAWSSWPDLANGTLTSPLPAPGSLILSSMRLLNVPSGAIGGGIIKDM